MGHGRLEELRWTDVCGVRVELEPEGYHLQAVSSEVDQRKQRCAGSHVPCGGALARGGELRSADSPAALIRRAQPESTVKAAGEIEIVEIRPSFRHLLEKRVVEIERAAQVNVELP